MIRLLIAAVLLPTAAHAQRAEEPRQADAPAIDRPMPHYDDGSDDKEFPYRETYGTEDARRDSYEDAAHAADRARTAALNRGARSGRPVPARDDSAYRAARAAHQRDMAAYKQAQGDYADRVARWHTQLAACQAGDPTACNGPER